MRIENQFLKRKIIEQLTSSVFKGNSISNENIKKIKKITVDTTMENIPSKDLELLPSLQELYLIGNNIKEYRLNKIGKINTLKFKTESVNNIPDLKKIKKLNDLSIELMNSDNSENYLLEIEKLKKLNYLELINFNIKSVSFLKNMNDLYKLKIISSNKNIVTDFKDIKDLYLESIHLENIIIDNENIMYLNNDAKELYLINCDIDSLNVFETFKRLKVLDLTDNNIEHEELNSLKLLKEKNKKVKVNLKNNKIENKTVLKGLNMTEVETISCSEKPILYSVDDFNYNVNLSNNIKYDLCLTEDEFFKIKYVVKHFSKINEITVDFKNNKLTNDLLNLALQLNGLNIIFKLNDFTKINTNQLKAIKKYRNNIKFNITHDIERQKEIYDINEFIEMYIKLCDIVNNAPTNLNDLEKVCFAYLTIGNNYRKIIQSKKHYNRNNKNLYSLFIQNKGYEDGYADILKLLLTALNLKIVTIEGKDSNGKLKTWNKVLINNTWYNMDLELDLGELEKGNTLKYFLRGEYDFNHEMYTCEDEFLSQKYGLDMKTLIDCLYLMNKRIVEKKVS